MSGLILEKRNALQSVAFYGCSIVVIVLLNVSGHFKSGPCTPNLDVLSVFLLAILNALLLVLKGVQFLFLKKPTKYSFFIHLIAFLVGTTLISLDLV